MRGWARLRSHSSPQVLDVIAPPYTSDFVHLFLPILENDSIAGTIKTEGEHDPVTEFIGRQAGGAGQGMAWEGSAMCHGDGQCVWRKPGPPPADESRALCSDGKLKRSVRQQLLLEGYYPPQLYSLDS